MSKRLRVSESKPGLKMEKIFYASREELQSRISRLQDKMAENSVDITVITGNVNLFYFSGSCQSGHLLIPAEGEAVYLVRKSLERAREESPLSRAWNWMSSLL